MTHHRSIDTDSTHAEPIAWAEIRLNTVANR